MLLALFAQMERTYTLERAAHARSVAEAKGRRVGCPVTVDPGMLDYAVRLRAEGKIIPEIVKATKIPRTSLYRYLPPRPVEPVTVGGDAPAGRDDDVFDGLLDTTRRSSQL